MKLTFNFEAMFQKKKYKITIAHLFKMSPYTVYSAHAHKQCWINLFVASGHIFLIFYASPGRPLELGQNENVYADISVYFSTTIYIINNHIDTPCS